MRKRDAELRAHYRAHYLQKAQILRDHHQSLVAFAGKVKAQRAQLKSVRLQMEEKLKAANLLYEQVEEMRRVLAETPGAATQPDMRGR